MISKHFGNNGTLIGVTVMIDNGGSQYMTIEEYNNFIKKRENGKKSD